MRVLYIDIDSLRPDHLCYYRYHRQTSPNIDALAAAGWRNDLTRLRQTDRAHHADNLEKFGGQPFTNGLEG